MKGLVEHLPGVPIDAEEASDPPRASVGDKLRVGLRRVRVKHPLQWPGLFAQQRLDPAQRRGRSFFEGGHKGETAGEGPEPPDTSHRCQGTC